MGLWIETIIDKQDNDRYVGGSYSTTDSEQYDEKRWNDLISDVKIRNDIEYICKRYSIVRHKWGIAYRNLYSNKYYSMRGTSEEPLEIKVSPTDKHIYVNGKFIDLPLNKETKYELDRIINGDDYNI